MRAIGISIRGAGIALMITAVTGCTLKQSPEPSSEQVDSKLVTSTG